MYFMPVFLAYFSTVLIHAIHIEVINHCIKLGTKKK